MIRVIGLSKPGSFCIENIMRMATNPIIFTLANPTPALATLARAEPRIESFDIETYKKELLDRLV